MSEVFKVRSRLAEQIDRPGGMTARLAMERVGRELTQAGPKSREVVGETLVLLEDIARTQTAGLDAVYDAAAAVIDVAGLFDERILCDAAYSLCELVDRLRSQEAGDWPAVVVHVEALRLIYSAEPADTLRFRPIVDGLWRVTEKYRERPLEG